MKKRVFLIVLDSFGIGAAPDALRFGDPDANTLKRISQSPLFACDNLMQLGLGNIDGVDCLPKNQSPLGAVARLTERSGGKDTTVGHWEIAGVISKEPLPTYPEGFPEEVISAFCKATGKGVLCNKPYSGTKVLDDFGEQHLKTGDLIVYTSADSVFQIAAHEDIVPPAQLYDYCEKAREILKGEHGVGRVIARPFTGKAPHFERTPRRHDFSLLPPADTMLDAITASGKQVISVGKISDIFAGKGIGKSIPTVSNEDGMEKTLEIQSTDFDGICFVNLVDFDMKYGHRQDIDGYAKALAVFDNWLPRFMENMQENDLLLITGDHGCDPGDDSTDHTREYTPLLMVGAGITPENYGTRDTFADIAATITRYLDVPFDGAGNSLI